MRNKANQIIRLFEILSALFSFSIYFYILAKIKKVSDKERAIYLRKTLEKLGSVFIKLGQMLALRPDFLSDVYCNELYKLLDKVPSFPKHDVETIINKEFNATAKTLFP